MSHIDDINNTNIKFIVNATEYGFSEDQRYLFEDRIKEEERGLNERYVNKCKNKEIKSDVDKRKMIGGPVKNKRNGCEMNIIAVDFSSMY